MVDYTRLLEMRPEPQWADSFYPYPTIGVKMGRHGAFQTESSGGRLGVFV
jgi:hypothetical protein